MKQDKKKRVDKVSRTQNVTRNIMWAFINQLTTIILSMVSRKVFLEVLGTELLGANSLFADVFSLFSFADLGFGTAVVFSLYKPIADGNYDKIKALLKYYRTIYRYVIGVLIIIGIAFIPFLPNLKTSIPIRELTFYYLLYQANCIIGYVCAYRETYISACQQQSTLTKFGILFSIGTIIFQIIIVKIAANYSFYVITALVIAIIRKVVINFYIISKFPETKVSNALPLEKEEKKNIFVSAKAVLVHRLGNLAINQTDSLIVSIFINMEEWGLMSNYLVLKTAVGRLLENIYSAILPSMGNLVAEENEDKQMKVFNKYDFLNFWLYLFCYVALGTLSSQFINIYFGKDYVLNEVTVFIFFTAFFVDGLRSPVSAMREANGSFRTDQWYTVLAAAVNLVVSIVLVQIIGLNGVYIGTCCAMIVLHICRSTMLFKSWEELSAYKYLFRVFAYIIIGVVVYFITFYVQKAICIKINSVFISFILCCISVVVLPNLSIIILYRKQETFIEIKQIFKEKLSRFH